jgi:hypothetical protein
MDNLFRAVVAVPKAEIDRREEEWKDARKGLRNSDHLGAKKKRSGQGSGPGARF